MLFKRKVKLSDMSRAVSKQIYAATRDRITQEIDEYPSEASDPQGVLKYKDTYMYAELLGWWIAATGLTSSSINQKICLCILDDLIGEFTDDDYFRGSIKKNTSALLKAHMDRLCNPDCSFEDLIKNYTSWVCKALRASPVKMIEITTSYTLSIKVNMKLSKDLGKQYKVIDDVSEG